MALQPKRGRPSLSDLILDAVDVCTARKGASLALIKKMLATKGYDVERNRGRLKAALGSLLDKGLLRRVTGSGLSGSFRIGRVGKRRAEGAGRSSGRAAAGETSKRAAGKAKEPGRGVERLKKPGRPKGKEAAVEGEATGDAQKARGPVEAAAPEGAS
ncbi:uncharacterized protein LJ264_014537 [Porphyrio hochstetteri]